MEQDLKVKWVAALRSGSYKQTKGVLHNNDGYCCLGVLCDVVGVEWSENVYNYYVPSRLSDDDANIIVDRDAVGLTQEQHDKLYDMNDGTGGADREHSFVEIADWIETNL